MLCRVPVAPSHPPLAMAHAAAASYYDSADADAFYTLVWGASENGHAHVGIYEPEDGGVSIRAASDRATEVLVAAVSSARAEAPRRVVDLGAGYGGTARTLARTYPEARVTCVNISAVENEANVRMNEAEGVADRVSVVLGSFDDVPLDSASADTAVSQDAFLHAEDRNAVMAEAARVLEPGGLLVFTDIMQSTPGAHADARMGAVLARLDLKNLGDVTTYKALADANGLEFKRFEDRSEQLARHYGAVLDELRRCVANQGGELRISDAYTKRAEEGLAAWIDAANAGTLAWGALTFVRR